MSEHAPSPRTGPLTWGFIVTVVAAIVAFSVMRSRVEMLAPQGDRDPDADRTASPDGTADTSVSDPEIAGDASPPNRSGILGVSPGAMPDVAAVERSGRALRTADLAGKWNAVSFIFTTCTATCSRLCAELKKLSDATAKDDQFRLVCVSVQPSVDTPEKLTVYADALGADRDRWLFLRTTGDDVQMVARKLAVNNDPARPILHANSVSILDPQGRVVAKYEPLEDPEWLPRLLRELTTLRAPYGPGGDR